MLGDKIVVFEGDRRPVWLIAQEWYRRVAEELESIAKNGGVKTSYGLFPVSARGRLRALRQAQICRKAAEYIGKQQLEYQLRAELEE